VENLGRPNLQRQFVVQVNVFEWLRVGSWETLVGLVEISVVHSVEESALREIGRHRLNAVVVPY
jgi:hypothetical protein